MLTFMPNAGWQMNEKRVRIPNLDVKLSSTEIAVTQTRQFQRLFHLKQLRLAYLVYPALRTHADFTAFSASMRRVSERSTSGNEDFQSLRTRTRSIDQSLAEVQFVGLPSAPRNLGPKLTLYLGQWPKNPPRRNLSGREETRDP